MAASTDKDDRGNGTPSTEERNFECNICFDTATNAVVSMCGHLFCWPCIHTWMEARPQDTPTCPVCKSVIDKEKLIPLYGRGSDQKDPRESLPPRPAGQREEAPEDNNNTGYFGDGMFNGINVSFGVGGFPFGFGLGPALTIQTGRMGGQHHNVNIGHRGNRMQHQGRRGSQEEEQRKTMARLLLTFAILFIIMIIFT